MAYHFSYPYHHFFVVYRKTNQISNTYTLYLFIKIFNKIFNEGERQGDGKFGRIKGCIKKAVKNGAFSLHFSQPAKVQDIFFIFHKDHFF